MTISLTVETWGVDLRTRVKNLGAKEQAIYPPLKLRVFCDGITTSVKGRNKEVVEMVKKR